MQMKVCRDSFTFLTELIMDAPLKIIKIKNKSNKPWVTGCLRKSIKIRNQLYKKCLTTHNSYYHDKHKLDRNKIVAINKIYRAR